MAETVNSIINWLRTLAPLELAESWDNVGLLLGDRDAPVSTVLTCLSVTSEVADEAISTNVQLVVTHHPIFFKPVRTLTCDDAQGRMVLRLVRAGVAVYSAHTAYDSAATGINQQWSEQLGLREISPLRPSLYSSQQAGAGRMGRWPSPQPALQVIDRLKSVCQIPIIQWSGNPEAIVSKVGLACGSAGEFLDDARAAGCELFITGEARFHTLLEAREKGICLAVVGHYASERPAMEQLARQLAAAFPKLTVLASQSERDPGQWS